LDVVIVVVVVAPVLLVNGDVAELSPSATTTIHSLVPVLPNECTLCAFLLLLCNKVVKALLGEGLLKLASPNGFIELKILVEYLRDI
jgi:hypothetical protein